VHRFYIELQRVGRVDDEAHVMAAVQLAARLQLPVVATHPMQFSEADDYEAHEARMCIADGEILSNPKRVRKFHARAVFQVLRPNGGVVCRCSVQPCQHAGNCQALQLDPGAGQAAVAGLSHTPLVNGVRMSPEEYFPLRLARRFERTHGSSVSEPGRA
jgi:DNA polymerase-3 subunit alpha